MTRVDTGSYRVENLTPGSVFLHTATHSLFPTAANATSQAYLPVYYPNTPDRVSAQAIEVKPGQEARADMNLSPAPVYTVTGTVSGVPPGQSVMISRTRVEGDFIEPIAVQYNPSTGRFAISMVPSGESMFEFETNAAPGTALESVERISVDGADVKGLQIVLQPVTEISVQVNKPAFPPPQANVGANRPVANMVAQVQLVSAKSGDNRRYFSTRTPASQENDSLSQVIRGARPGQYRVMATALGSGCIDSVSSGGTDLMRDLLAIEPGMSPQPIVVNVSNECATLTGTVRRQKPDSGGLALVISPSPSFNPRLVPLQPDGSFTITNLSPGSYRVLALSDVDGLAYAEPEATRDLPGQQVELQASQKAAVALDLIDRSSKQ